MEFPNKADGPNKPQLGPGAPVPPKEKKTPVVSGARQVKRPLTRRFFTFLLSESPKSAASRIGTEVLVPQMKMGFEAAVHAFVSNLFWGNAANRPMSNIVKQATLRGNVPYNIISGTLSSQQQVRQAVVQQRSTGNYEDIVLESVRDAQAVLADILNDLERYGLVSVGSLYESAGIATQPSDEAFGWTDLSAARIVPGRGGFILELPRPTLL